MTSQKYDDERYQEEGAEFYDYVPDGRKLFGLAALFGAVSLSFLACQYHKATYNHNSEYAAVTVVQTHDFTAQ